MGGPAAEDKLVLSSLGLCWPHSLSLYLDSNDLKLESLTMMTLLNKMTFDNLCITWWQNYHMREPQKR